MSKNVGGQIQQIRIKWRNKEITDEMTPFETELTSLSKCIDFKNELVPSLGIPIDFVDVYKGKTLLKDEDKMVNYVNDVLLITTNPQKQLENTVKVRLYDILAPNTFYEIELEKEKTVEDLKEELKKKAALFVEDNSYISIMYYKQVIVDNKVTETLVEIFESTPLHSLALVCLQEMHFIIKDIPNEEIRFLIGKGMLTLTITSQKTFVVQIAQSETIGKLKEIIMQNDPDLNKDNFALISGSDQFKKDQDDMRLFGKFQNNSPIQVLRYSD